MHFTRKQKTISPRLLKKYAAGVCLLDPNFNFNFFVELILPLQCCS